MIVRKGKDVSADNPDDTVKGDQGPRQVGYGGDGHGCGGLLDAGHRRCHRGHDEGPEESHPSRVGPRHGRRYLGVPVARKGSHNAHESPERRYGAGAAGNLDVEVPNEYLADCREVAGLRSGQLSRLRKEEVLDGAGYTLLRRCTRERRLRRSHCAGSARSTGNRAAMKSANSSRDSTR
ncbi:MAG: hypothetical protein MZV70_02685 [Desulfobacterales bacterium]|nr:hypothetical protein [Desulfobacterales bacterium]